MKLDTRIMDGKKPLTCFDAEEAKAFIGKACYFTNNLREYADLTTVTTKRTLGRVESYFYAEFDSGMYAYCLPCEWVTESEEKKLRPYTFMEFQDKFTVGRPIKFREKGKLGCERYLILNGYWHEMRNGLVTTYIYIGPHSYSLDELFNCYEWQEHYTEDFKPFGVEEE